MIAVHIETFIGTFKSAFVEGTDFCECRVQLCGLQTIIPNSLPLLIYREYAYRKCDS